MLFILSVIFTFGTGITVLVLSLINNQNVLISILFAILAFFGVLAVFSLIIIFILVFFWAHLAKTEKPHSKFRWALARDIAMFSIFWLHVRVRVTGLEKLPKDKPIVFYGNHQNFLDMFILYQALKDFHHATLYKSEILNYPLVRGVAKGLGGVPLNRFDDREAAKSILETIKKVKNGQTFYIFPEGTRTKNSQLNEYKAGSFKIVQKTDATMAIVLIDNAYKITRQMVIKKTIVDVTIVDVLEKEDLPDNTHDIAELVYRKTNEALQQGRQTKKYLRVPKRYQKKM